MQLCALNLKKNLRLVKGAKEGTFPFPFRGKRALNRSHNSGKALGEGLGDKFSYRRMDVKTYERKKGKMIFFVL